MPYGIPTSKGGDSLKNTAKMEACIAAVSKSSPNLDKGSVIAICKKQLGYTNEGKG